MLTVQQATKQARRHVDKLMPGVMATVESKLSHDLDTDTPTVITTVTFPAEVGDGTIDRLAAHLSTLTGYREGPSTQGPARITITRAR